MMHILYLSVSVDIVDAKSDLGRIYFSGGTDHVYLDKTLKAILRNI